MLKPRINRGGRVVRSPIFEQSYKAVQFWISNEWSRRWESPKLTVTAARTLEGFRQADVADGKAGGEVGSPNRQSLPLVTTIIASLQDRVGPHTPWQMQHFGFRMGRVGNGNSGNEVLYERVRPIDLGIGVRFTASSDEEIKAFAQMLLENAPSVVINIRNKSTGGFVEIAVALETQYSLTGPQMGNPGETSSIETTMVCKSFTGVTQRFNAINKLRIAAFDQIDSANLFDVVMAGDRKIVLDYNEQAELDLLTDLNDPILLGPSPETSDVDEGDSSISTDSGEPLYGD